MYRFSYLLLILLIISCGSGSGSDKQPRLDDVKLPDIRINGNQLVYQGAFNVTSSANYSQGPLAYNPTNNSLFIAGHDQNGTVGEVAIPALLDRATVADLNTASTLQSFRAILDENSNSSGIDTITGMLYVDGQLIVNTEERYDASGSNTDTTLVIRDAENLSSSAIDGYYELTDGPRAAGYIGPIPQEWQASFGGSYFTGWSSVYSIISRYSVGPSFFTFDSDSLLNGSASSGPIADTPYMNYDYGVGQYLSPDALEHVQGSASPIWNFMSEAVFGFIVPGTRTFAVFGSSGGVNSGIGYKITQDDGNSCDGYCPYSATDHYNYYWLFDLQEILDASNVYDPQPYAYGEFIVPFDNSNAPDFHRIIGGTFDPASGMLYLTLRGAGEGGPSDRQPLIVGYQLSN